MASVEKLTVTGSAKGQVILPRAIRQRRGWCAGTRLIVEDAREGVLLKPAPAFVVMRPEGVFASLPHGGKPKALQDMNASVLAEARRWYARN